MEKPVIYYVDDEPLYLDDIRQALSRRYAADYEVLGEGSPAAALRSLESLKEAGREVAVLLTDIWMPEMNGADFLVQAHELFPPPGEGCW